MLLRYFGLAVLLGTSALWAQDLKALPRCTGPECAERVRTRDQKPPRRAQRAAERQRVDRYGLPKSRRRAERFRLPAYSPRHKALERAEAFSPYSPRLRPRSRAERFTPRAYRPRHKSLAQAERLQLRAQAPKHSNRAERFGLQIPSRKAQATTRAERLRAPHQGARHSNRAEAFALRTPKRRLRAQAYAERLRLPLMPIPHRNRAEKHRYTPKAAPHKGAAEQYAYRPPTTRHQPRAERFRIGLPLPFHRPTPQKDLYTLPTPRHRRPSQNPCEPPALPHPSQKWSEGLACGPRPVRHRRLERRQACAPPPVRHRPTPQTAYCYTPPIRHKPTSQKAYCYAPSIRHKAPPQSAFCYAPPVRHKSFDRYTCEAPALKHRLPIDYEVPCDAQRRGIMTQTERFAHDLRYLFTNHRKHCQFQSAYSGVSVGEWVNTQAYGRVPVAGVKMGWRVYVFAHYYDKRARAFRKPRLEKRKVWSLYQLEVWVPEPAKRSSGRRRYIKGLAGIEGFGNMEGMRLVKKRLSPEETKRIQIEKLVRKRQIAWLVRAYPEERVRLPEWIRAYAGPKPPHFWPGVDYRLLEVWQ